MNPKDIDTDSSFDPGAWICDEAKARLLHRCGLLFRLYLDNSFNLPDPAYQGTRVNQQARDSLLRVIHDDWTSRLITNDEFAHLVDLTLCY